MYFMTRRSEAIDCFMQFLDEVQSMGYSVSGLSLRTDNAREYVMGHFKQYCIVNGITQHTSAPYQHTGNAMAERIWRTIMNKTRAFMHTAGMDPKYWPLAVSHAVYVYNRTPHSSLDMAIPHEIVSGETADLEDLRVFGCPAYAHVDESLRGKQEDRAIAGVYVGKEERSSSILVLLPETGEIVRSGMVQCIEEIDKYGLIISDHSSTPADPFDTQLDEDQYTPASLSDQTTVCNIAKVHDCKTFYHAEDEETYGIVQVEFKKQKKYKWVYAKALGHEDSDPEGITMLQKHLAQTKLSASTNPFHPIFTSVGVKTRRGAHSPAIIVSHDAGSKYQYGVIHTAGRKSFQDVMTGMVVFDETSAACYSRVSQDQLIFPGVLASIAVRPGQMPIPQSWRQAQQLGQHWVDCTHAEMQSILDFGVLMPVDREDIPEGANIIGSHFVYDHKLNADGSTDKFKARLVARGDLMHDGVDYHETFAHVSDLSTVRVVLSTSMAYGMTPRHVDVKCAFLNSTLSEEVYMRLPQGFDIEGKRFCKCIKSIYGLKQAAHDWYELQDSFLVGPQAFDSRMQRSESDPCLYHFEDGDLRVMISTHVDDYVVSTNSDEWYSEFVTAFGAKFQIKELGVVNHLLKMSVDWSPDVCRLGQELQIAELVEKYGLTTAKPVHTPMETGLHLPRPDTCTSTLPYRQLCGSLLWIARNTRPDIYYHVIYLSQFSSCYGEEHFKALKRVLRYLSTTRHYILEYTRPDMDLSLGAEIEGFCDSDWAGEPSDRVSVSGGLTFLFGNLVSWSTRKQKTIALSSCEAEYMAMTDEMKDLLHVSQMMEPICGVRYPVSLNIDNQGAGYMAQNSINNQRTKHIDIRYHFIRHHIKAGTIELFYVETKSNVSDAMTKSLPVDDFLRHVKKIMYTGG